MGDRNTLPRRPFLNCGRGSGQHIPRTSGPRGSGGRPRGGAVQRSAVPPRAMPPRVGPGGSSPRASTKPHASAPQALEPEEAQPPATAAEAHLRGLAARPPAASPPSSEPAPPDPAVRAPARYLAQDPVPVPVLQPVPGPVASNGALHLRTGRRPANPRCPACRRWHRELMAMDHSVAERLRQEGADCGSMRYCDGVMGQLVLAFVAGLRAAIFSWLRRLCDAPRRLLGTRAPGAVAVAGGVAAGAAGRACRQFGCLSPGLGTDPAMAQPGTVTGGFRRGARRRGGAPRKPYHARAGARSPGGVGWGSPRPARNRAGSFPPCERISRCVNVGGVQPAA
jgi:hypothetical protein